MNAKTTKWTGTRTAVGLAVAALAAVGLAACTSSTVAESAPTDAATSSAAIASAPAAGTSTPLAPAPTTCPEFNMTAAHMSTYWQYLSLNIGSNNDETPTLANLSSGIAAMQDLAPKCAPKAVESIDAFAATVAAIEPVYTTDPTSTDAQKVTEALAAMQEAGIAMFADMGQSDYAWK